jgi:hypothetical protein
VLPHVSRLLQDNTHRLSPSDSKRTRRKSSSRKREPVRSQSRTALAVAVEVAEVVVMGEFEQDSVDETEAAVIDALDEHFPADYGRSE